MTAKLTRHEAWLYAGLTGSLLLGTALLLGGGDGAGRKVVAGVPAGAPPAGEVARGAGPGRDGQRRDVQGHDGQGRDGQGRDAQGRSQRPAQESTREREAVRDAPPAPPAPLPAPVAPADPAPPVGSAAREDHDRRAWQTNLAAVDTNLIDQLERMGCDQARLERVRQALQERAAARERTREEFEARRIDLKEAGKRGARAQARFDRALGEALTPEERARLDPEGARAAVAVQEARR